MNAIKHEIIEDPDTGERMLRRTFTVDFTGKTPFNDTDLAELDRMAEDASAQGRLRRARAELPKLHGLPEHDPALDAIVQGEYYAARSEWEPAELALMQFYAFKERGTRRSALRQARVDRSKGGKNKAESSRPAIKKRNDEIEALAREYLADGTSRTHKVSGDVAARFKLTDKTVRGILIKRGVLQR